MMLAKQSITFFPSQDLQATKRFYQDSLGLELVRDQGSCLIFKVSSTGYVGFCEHLKASEQPGVIITLVLDNVDELYQQLFAQGVPIEAPPSLNEQYQIYHFFARDPNAYRLEIQRFLVPLA